MIWYFCKGFFFGKSSLESPESFLFGKSFSSRQMYPVLIFVTLLGCAPAPPPREPQGEGSTPHEDGSTPLALGSPLSPASMAALDALPHTPIGMQTPMVNASASSHEPQPIGTHVVTWNCDGYWRSATASDVAWVAEGWAYNRDYSSSIAWTASLPQRAGN